MSIVNVKVEHIRKQGYGNLEDWMKDPSNVYVGRAGIVFIRKERFPKQTSVWANPFKVGKDGTRDEVIGKFRAYMKERLKSDPSLVQDLLQLEGKCLGCWCKPEACHGDVLLELVQEYKQ